MAKKAVTKMSVFSLIAFAALFLLMNMAIRAMSFSEVSVLNWNVFTQEYEVFFQGARFDLMVFCFWLVPFLILHFRGFFFNTLKKYVLQAYAFLTLLWMAIVSCLDLLFLSKFRHRMRWDDFVHFSPQWGAVTLIQILKIMTIFVLFLLLYRRARWWINTGPLQLGFRYLIIVLLAALGARGTLGEYHLRREHCEISTQNEMNEICLSPLWNYTK